MKSNDHVYSFLLFVSSRPRYQAHVIYRKWPTRSLLAGISIDLIKVPS